MLKQHAMPVLPNFWPNRSPWMGSLPDCAVLWKIRGSLSVRIHSLDTTAVGGNFLFLPKQNAAPKMARRMQLF